MLTTTHVFFKKKKHFNYKFYLLKKLKLVSNINYILIFDVLIFLCGRNFSIILYMLINSVLRKCEYYLCNVFSIYQYCCRNIKCIVNYYFCIEWYIAFKNLRIYIFLYIGDTARSSDGLVNRMSKYS